MICKRTNFFLKTRKIGKIVNWHHRVLFHEELDVSSWKVVFWVRIDGSQMSPFLATFVVVVVLLWGLCKWEQILICFPLPNHVWFLAFCKCCDFLRDPIIHVSLENLHGDSWKGYGSVGCLSISFPTLFPDTFLSFLWFFVDCVSALVGLCDLRET